MDGLGFCGAFAAVEDENARGGELVCGNGAEFLVSDRSIRFALDPMGDTLKELPLEEGEGLRTNQKKTFPCL